MTLILILTGTYAQIQSTDTIKTQMGSQLKGMYIVGGIWAAGGFTLGIIANKLNEYPGSLSFLVPVHGAVWTSVPGSFLGLALSSISPKHKSRINRTFQLGTGFSIATKYREGRLFENDPIGGYFKLTSPEIWKWRYALSYVQYSDYAEINFDLHFVFKLGELTNAYVLLGNNYFLRTGTEFVGKLLQDAGVNYGAGLNFELSNRWNFSSEFRHTVAQSDHNWTVLAFGIHYYL